VVLTADSILARSTRRRQTSTGWNTAYIGANRYTLPPDEKPSADDALHPMAFLVEKGPGAVTRQRRRGALHRRLLGLRTDRRREVGHLVVHPTQPLGPRRPVYAGRAGGASCGPRPPPALGTDHRGDAGGASRRAVWGDGHFLSPGSRSGRWAGGLALPGTALHRDCRARAERRRWPILAGADGRRRGRWRRSVANQFLRLRRPGGSRLLPAPQALWAPNCCACNSAAARGIESTCYGRTCTGGSGPHRLRRNRLAQMSSTQFKVRFTTGPQVRHGYRYGCLLTSKLLRPPLAQPSHWRWL
jgi:hypothetical protein